MAVRLREENEGRVLVIEASGKVTKEDYEHFVPEVDRLIARHGKISILFEMHDFHGWDWGAAWEDTKFAVHHFRDIERLAVIGEKRWQKGMAIFCKPFTRAEIRYFEHGRAEEAHTWLLATPTEA
jgi:hypothetical protein